ncbi:MAG: hypothetical protein KJ574_03270 [Nanoarchaeota archaeon]|nr:hypothetical protein [Nanoarchaeota archaeon]
MQKKLDDIIKEAKGKQLEIAVNEAMQNDDFMKALEIIEANPEVKPHPVVVKVADALMEKGEYEKAIDLYNNHDRRDIAVKRYGWEIAKLQKEKKYDLIIKLAGILQEKGYNEVVIQD